MTDLPHPDSLRYYGASDLAVSTGQENDKTCHMVVGVDENDNIWILPDLVWMRLPSDTSIEAVIRLMAKYRPMLWWGEKGAISKSIGPFLRKRMGVLFDRRDCAGRRQAGPRAVDRRPHEHGPGVLPALRSMVRRRA